MLGTIYLDDDDRLRAFEEQPGRHRIMVKAVEVFGKDTSQHFTVELT